jgi:uncharacterized protein
MAGETDLDTMLRSLSVSRRPEIFVVVHRPEPEPIGEGVEAVLVEREGYTVVAALETAERHGWVFDFEATWLTLDVHSSLEAVGLTAAFSTVLADRGIACNVLAGYHHDHLLVPVALADAAVEALLTLRTR